MPTLYGNMQIVLNSFENWRLSKNVDKLTYFVFRICASVEGELISMLEELMEKLAKIDFE